MSIETLPTLDTFVDWITATDEHATHRLGLLAQAKHVFSSQESLPTEASSVLAEKLERWRYQHLNHCQEVGHFEPRDRELVDALDLAANRLWGRAPRPPRLPRGAVEQASHDDPLWHEWLAPATPLEKLVQLASERTCELVHRSPDDDTLHAPQKRRILLYAPLYLSNFCINHCRYCGFRYSLPIERTHLTRKEVLAEAQILRGRGFRSILLVAGDFPRLTTTEYFVATVSELTRWGICPSLEIAPQSTASYEKMVAAGACGVTLYQETYNESLYHEYHPRGSKTSFDWRLEGLDRAADAGFERFGLGILLGLAEPRDDFLAMLRHARYLQNRFPDRKLAFSLPRIHQAPDDFQVPYSVDDTLFVRLYCILRLAFPRATLVLSTRESVAMRQRLVHICINQLSAGSCTAPGGYSENAAKSQPAKQFPVNDARRPADVANWLRAEGFEPTWDTEDID